MSFPKGSCIWWGFSMINMRAEGLASDGQSSPLQPDCCPWTSKPGAQFPRACVLWNLLYLLVAGYCFPVTLTKAGPWLCRKQRFAPMPGESKGWEPFSLK